MTCRTMLERNDERMFWTCLGPWELVSCNCQLDLSCVVGLLHPPISIAHFPVPHPISSILRGSLRGAKKSRPLNRTLRISYCRSIRSISNFEGASQQELRVRSEAGRRRGAQYLVVWKQVCWKTMVSKRLGKQMAGSCRGGSLPAWYRWYVLPFSRTKSKIL